MHFIVKTLHLFKHKNTCLPVIRHVA